jgi:hypothetical protein
MSRTRMARLMLSQGVRPRRRERQEKTAPPKPSPRLADSFREAPAEEAGKVGSVYRVPDAWEAPKSLQKKSLPPAAEKEASQSRLKPGPKKKAQHKRRKTAISICVSEEEDFLLRKHAHSLGMSFSEWARLVMFKAMKMDIPSRT